MGQSDRNTSKLCFAFAVNDTHVCALLQCHPHLFCFTRSCCQEQRQERQFALASLLTFNFSFILRVGIFVMNCSINSCHCPTLSRRSRLAKLAFRTGKCDQDDWPDCLTSGPRPSSWILGTEKNIIYVCDRNTRACLTRHTLCRQVVNECLNYPKPAFLAWRVLRV